MKPLRVAALGSLLAAAACTSLIGLPDVPADPDASVSADAGPDHSSQRGPDGGHPVGDAGRDRAAPHDAGHDRASPPDARRDQSSPHDAGRDRAVSDAAADRSVSDALPDRAVTDAMTTCASDAGSGAVGVLGCPCTTVGTLACNGNDSSEAIVCAEGAAGLVWQGNGACSSGERCDTAEGPNQGVCQDLDPDCKHATPGQTVCVSVVDCVDAGGFGDDEDGVDLPAPCLTASSTILCGPDLLTSTPVATCTGMACASGACTGVCEPGETQCSGTLVEACNDSGEWGSASTCYAGNPAVECCGAECTDTLVDNENCGACGVRCAGTCSGGGCLTKLVSDEEEASGVAADSTYAYYVDLSPVALAMRVPLTGGTATPLGAEPDGENESYEGSLGAIAINGSNAYWFGGILTPPQVLTAPLVTGTVTDVNATGTFPGGVIQLGGIGLSGTDVYFADSVGGSIYVVALDGSLATPGVVASGQSTPGALAVDPNGVYWINEVEGGSVMALSLAPDDGGLPPANPIAMNTDQPTSLAVNGGTVFWTSSSGLVESVATSGGMVSTFATGLDSPSAIAVNDASIACATSSGIMVFSRASGVGTNITSAVGVGGVAFAGTAVVWTIVTPGDGQGGVYLWQPPP